MLVTYQPSTVQTGVLINEMEVVSVPQIHGVNGEIEITSQVGTSGVEFVPSADTETPSTNVSGNIIVSGAATTVSLRLVIDFYFLTVDSDYSLSLTVDGVTTSKTGTVTQYESADETVSVLLDVGTYPYTAVANLVQSQGSTGFVTLRGGDQNQRPSTITLEEGIATITADRTLIDNPNGLETDRIASKYDRLFSSYIDFTPNQIDVRTSDLDVRVGSGGGIIMDVNLGPTLQLNEIQGFFINCSRFRITPDNSTSTVLEYSESTNTISIASDTLEVTSPNITGGILPPPIPTTDGDYNLQIASSGATWEVASTGTTTVVAGTANEIVNTISGNTNTLSLDTAITGAITNNTAKNSYPTADSTKLGNITVTQAVDLDTIESNVATNNAKITYPGSAAIKLGGIEALADVTDKANVDTAIGTGGATTDYYASDKTWKTIPSAGVGDAVLANTQTFTGQNTFSDTAVFSDSNYIWLNRDSR